MKRCIYYDTDSGQRCRKPVNVYRQELCLCKQHSESVLLRAWVAKIPRDHRDELAECNWETKS